jgi:hypothetical protein
MIRRVTATLSILLLLISFSSNAYADAVCKDGWKSKSSGSGTCSWHGGVLNWLPKRGSKSSYGRDSYYDRSDNGVDPCTYRKYKESKKECERRVKISRDMAIKEILRRINKYPLPQ